MIAFPGYRPKQYKHRQNYLLFMNSTKMLLLSLAFLIPASPFSAQTVDPELSAKFDEVLNNVRALLNIKSLGASVQLPDGALWAGASGISSIDPAENVTPNHTYLIGSVMKTVTSACILQLVDEGTLSLSDSLHKWLDTIPHINPNITIRQLLQHKSGIFDVLGNQSLNQQIGTFPGQIWTLDAVVNNYSMPPNFQPGATFDYSNTNYMLLGMIIKAATGNPYYEELRTRFFVPLGMNTMMIPPYDGLPDTIAHAWADFNGDNVSLDEHDFFSNWNSMFSVAGPAGCYFAKPSEMAIWMRKLMGGNLLSPTTLADAQTTIITNLPAATKYGLGMMERKFLGLKSYGHGGDLVYSSLAYYFPTKDISIAVMGNDASKNSWALAPALTVLLKAFLDFEMQSSVHESGLIALDLETAPNPFSDHIQVTADFPASSDEIRLILTNAMGQEVATQTYLNTDSAALLLQGLEGLSEGVYFLNTVVDGHQSSLIKMVKVR